MLICSFKCFTEFFKIFVVSSREQFQHLLDLFVGRFLKQSQTHHNYTRKDGNDQRHASVMAAREFGIHRPLFCTAAGCD